MPITILDYVKSVVGDKDFYTAEDYLASGVDIIGGCQTCAATIAIYNAYPSTSGYWRCADCIGDTGYATVANFTAQTAATSCPACGNTDNLHEIDIFAESPFDLAESPFYAALECGDCGEVWQP
jgi:hypothetical protein